MSGNLKLKFSGMTNSIISNEILKFQANPYCVAMVISPVAREILGFFTLSLKPHFFKNLDMSRASFIYVIVHSSNFPAIYFFSHTEPVPRVISGPEYMQAFRKNTCRFSWYPPSWTSFSIFETWYWRTLPTTISMQIFKTNGCVLRNWQAVKVLVCKIPVSILSKFQRSIFPEPLEPGRWNFGIQKVMMPCFTYVKNK